MFKSKKWLFLLFPLVLGIWGTIGYQIVDGLNPDLPKSESFELSFRESETKTSELLELQIPERDPFLETIKTKKNKSSSNNSALKVKVIDEIQWPTIEYLGYVKKDASRNSRAVALMINGNNHIIKVGGVQDSLKLTKATDDYVILRYKRKDKKISKR